jgi:hypothetical protein
MSCFKIGEGPSSFRQLTDFPLIAESQLLRERGLQVFFEELAVPAVAQHEAHVDAMQPATLNQAFLEEPFTAGIGFR